MVRPSPHHGKPRGPAAGGGTRPTDAQARQKNLLDATFIVDGSRGLLPSHPRLVHVGLTGRY